MASFIDTNVLIYLVDEAFPEKKARAQEIVDEKLKSGNGIVSTQVLQEFYANSTRKLREPISSEAAEEMIREFVRSAHVVQNDTEVILAAISRTRTMSISFWDALIIEAALKGGAEKLLTEDLNHGQIIDGLEIANPFI